MEILDTTRIDRIGWVRYIIKEQGAVWPAQGLAIAKWGGKSFALDPKDRIYGLLGLTKINIVSDHTKSTSSKDVYCQYTKTWLQLRHEYFTT